MALPPRASATGLTVFTIVQDVSGPRPDPPSRPGSERPLQSRVERRRRRRRPSSLPGSCAAPAAAARRHHARRAARARGDAADARIELSASELRRVARPHRRRRDRRAARAARVAPARRGARGRLPRGARRGGCRPRERDRRPAARAAGGAAARRDARLAGARRLARRRRRRLGMGRADGRELLSRFRGADPRAVERVAAAAGVASGTRFAACAPEHLAALADGLREHEGGQPAA